MTAPAVLALIIGTLIGFAVAVAVIRVAVGPLLVELRGLRADVAAATGRAPTAAPTTAFARRFPEPGAPRR